MADIKSVLGVLRAGSDLRPAELSRFVRPASQA
jgi:hypothetical protein